MHSRTATALAGLLASLAISLVLWWYFETLLFFLFVPFVPFLFRNSESRTKKACPRCDFRTEREDYEVCPRDGTRLEPQN